MFTGGLSVKYVRLVDINITEKNYYILLHTCYVLKTALLEYKVAPIVSV